MSFDELYGWFKDRPKWLQDCARRLIEKEKLEQEDYNELLVLCKNEAVGKDIQYLGIQEDTLDLEESKKAIRLSSIANVCGVNALSSKKPVDFGEKPLSIVYGRNGSGKSGYIRLLKNACGVKNPDVILPNIFKNNEQTLLAELSYKKDGELKKVKWVGETIEELHGIEIYDTNCGHIYVNEKNEVTYEPFILRLFTQLAQACNYLTDQINNEIDLLPSQKPSFPNDLKETKAYIWYENISESINQDEITNITMWTTEDETERNELTKRFFENNPAEMAKELREKIQTIKDIVSNLKSITKELGNEKCEEFIKLKQDALGKRKIANEDAEKIFSQVPLSGVSSDAWRFLWEAARKYSEEYAYKSKKFPYISKDGRCVLCQRKLDKESKKRFVSFEKYVKGELQQKAIEAEIKYEKFSENLPTIPSSEEITIRTQAADINDKNTKEMLKDYVKNLKDRKQTLLNSKHIEEVFNLPSKKVLIDLVNCARILRKKAKSYDQDTKDQNSPQLEQKLRELKAKLWLNQQRQSIYKEIARLDKIAQLKNAIKLTDTTGVSRKKSILTEELITNAYIQRFHNELSLLKASSMSVSLKKTHTEAGKVYHQIYIQNTHMDIKTKDIFSEGEFRIVSLAAFLADTEAEKSKSTFIFDDPISSLDHVYEETVAQRLVKLCQNRQVIVFTHRLSLLGYLMKHANKHKLKYNIICLSQYHVGKVTELPITLKTTKEAVNKLLNEGISKVKKEFEKDDDDYEIAAKGLCSHIRILIESIVETDLLNGVIYRFSPEVQTKGKINALAKITEDDCNFIDGYMTKYSNYEHSQSGETPILPPSPEEIENDLKNIKEFIEKLKNRKKDRND